MADWCREREGNGVGAINEKEANAVKALMVVLMLCLFAASASAATMTPMSDSGLSGISAGYDSAAFKVEVEVKDQGQQFATALNLINAGGPVQVGNNILVVASPECATIEDAAIVQAVVNLQHQECSPCEFETAKLEVEIKDQGQQNVCALNLVNSAGAVNAGTNLLAVVSLDDCASIDGALIIQAVVNGSCQTSPLIIPGLAD
jgi:hypothetical protein